MCYTVYAVKTDIKERGRHVTCRKKMKQKLDVKKLTMSAVMIALSVALSLVKIIQMPLGGSVTLLSMLPVCMLSIMYGTRWGLTPQSLVGTIIFDYLVAFTVLGFAGLFRTKGVGGYIGGISLAMAMRVVSHVISGVIFFASWAPEGWNPFIYSICYNGAYMVPEAVFTFIGAVVLFKEPHTAKLFKVYQTEAKPAVH